MASVPTSEKNKSTLRNPFKYVLPKEIHEVPKKGFSTPLRQILQSVQTNQLLSDHKILNKQGIDSILKTHQYGQVYRTGLLFRILIFGHWLNHFQPEID